MLNNKTFMSFHPTTAVEFVSAVKDARVTFVKWSASFCGPCKRIQPLYDELAQTHSQSATFLVVDADEPEFESLASAYSISALPTFHVFVNQKLVDSFSGANPKLLKQFVHNYVVNN